MSAEKTVARSFIEGLQRRGIEKVFANSGTDHAPIVEALSAMQAAGDKTPDFHVVPHENTAVSMAQGYYLVSGKPAVVLVHVTVGTANSLCSLMNARRSSIPVLLMAGRNPLSQDGHAGSRSVPIHWGQDAFDQNAIVREFTKWEHELRAYQNIDALIDRALHIAMSEPRGPVYLTMPRELLADVDTTEPVGVAPTVAAAAPAADAIQELAERLAGADKPAIVTSTIGVDRDARDELEALAGQHAIPVIQSWPFAVNVISDHPMNLRTSGAEYLAEADVIFVCDSAVPWVPRRFKPRADAFVVQMSADPSYSMYPYRDFPADRLIAGSTLAGLQMLRAQMQDREVNQVAQRKSAIATMVNDAGKQREAHVVEASKKSPISAAWTASCINAVKADNAVVINELGVPFEHLDLTDDMIFVGETTAGGLGTALGLAIGAKIADPGRDVICCVGDGCFMFGNPTPSLLVARASNAPITVIVANNGLWYAVEHSTLDIYPDGAAAAAAEMPLTTFGASPDYAALAVACGAYGERVDDPNELEGALRRALECNANGQAAVLEVITEKGTR